MERYNRGMAAVSAELNWIDSQADRMVSLVTEWCEINSGSRNLPGLEKMSSRLQADFAVLGGSMQETALEPETVIDNTGHSIKVPLGKAISIRKRPNAAIQVFLGIHMDTVYGPDHPLQHVRRVDNGTLNGPGVADAKGGLCVMLIALQAFERSEFADRLGWEILINPDEELGSPGSAGLLKECAARHHLGLVFEPAHADGTLVGERKGSGNFTVVIHGRAAHAGRDFHHGRNAIHSAAELVVALEEINRTHPGVTVNVGRIDGGGPTNIVPDLAIVRFNARVPAHQHPEAVLAEIQRAIGQVSRRDGIRLELSGGFNAPPRPMDSATTSLYQQLAVCGAELGLNLAWHSSGGVSDANKLSAAGLPVIDTLGPAGGNLHNADEFLLVDTLAQKAKLSAQLLNDLARSRVAP
jgi:glutamate carboxypeptidase